MRSGKPTPSDAARILGASGASKGGKATAAKLTPKQRSAKARKMARARWAKRAAPDPMLDFDSPEEKLEFLASVAEAFQIAGEQVCRRAKQRAAKARASAKGGA